MREAELGMTNVDPETGLAIVLQSSKIKIRIFLESDINDTYISWLNDSDVVRFSNQRFLSHSRESCLHYLASFQGTKNLFMSLHQVSDDRPVGTMTAYISSHHGIADVGIMIGDKSVWGLGYGQDAWNTLTNWLLEQNNIRKLTAGTLKCNVGMIKLMERSSMTLEAVRKAQEIVEDNPVDILYYSKFNDS